MVLRASQTRAPGEVCFLLTRDLHGCRQHGQWPETGFEDVTNARFPKSRPMLRMRSQVDERMSFLVEKRTTTDKRRWNCFSEFNRPPTGISNNDFLPITGCER